MGSEMGKKRQERRMVRVESNCGSGDRVSSRMEEGKVD